MNFRNQLFVLFVLFLLVRLGTILVYKGTYYYYGMVANQFAIAEAAYNGHWFSQDRELNLAARAEAREQNRYIPIEKWVEYPGSGKYTTFPAQDLPGFGYLIAFTSRLFSSRLTSLYAFSVQVLLEGVSILLFVYCISLLLGEKVSFIAGLIYVAGYPFIWPVASQPMRDIFIMGTYSFSLTALLLFLRKTGSVLNYLIITLLVAAAALLLWIRPTSCYFLLVMPVFALFAKDRSRRVRTAVFAVMLFLPLLIFSYPYKQFNIRYYGTNDLDVLGRSLWAGMGIVKDNPYGFVRNDGALVPWVKSYYHKDVEYSSPEMNRLLGEYAREVIRKDPVYFAKTILIRTEHILQMPLVITVPRNMESIHFVSYGESGAVSLAEYVRRSPRDFIMNLFHHFIFLICGPIFFYVGVYSAILMIARKQGARLETIMLLSPFLYTMVLQIFHHFEPRYMATGAWVLVLPLAWYINTLVERRRLAKPCAASSAH